MADPGSLLPMPGITTPLRLLLFALQPDYVSTSRLPKPFSAAGFELASLSSPSSLLHHTRYIQNRYTLRSTRSAPTMLRDLERAFRSFRPAILMPCDERSIELLHYWVQREQDAPGQLSAPLMACLSRSLGSLERLPARSVKSDTQQLARSIGLRTPGEYAVTTPQEACDAAGRFGYPVVLKRSHGAGGTGVRICPDRAALLDAFTPFDKRAPALRTLRRRWLGRDWFPVRSTITVQQHIAGTPAMTCASALSGRTLAVLSGVALRTVHATGPASVTRLTPHAGMASSSAAMIEAFGASGILSFDFILDQNGREYLLECNPRPTTMLHLGHLVDVDLASALLDGLRGQFPSPPLSNADRDRTVAIFPQEWTRDPHSEALQDILHDAPWDDPRLFKAIVSRHLIPEPTG